jgi:hypothetical protein
MCGAHMEMVYRAFKLTCSYAQDGGDSSSGSYYCFSSAGMLVAGCRAFGFSASSGARANGAAQAPASKPGDGIGKAHCYNPASGHMLVKDSDGSLKLLLGSSCCSLAISNTKQFAISPDGRWLLVCTTLGQVRLISTSGCGPDAPAAPEGRLEQHQLQEADSLRENATGWSCCFSADSRWGAGGAPVPLHRRPL